MYRARLAAPALLPEPSHPGRGTFPLVSRLPSCLAIAAASLALTSSASGQATPQNDTFFTAGAGTVTTQKWLGSSDIRRGGQYFVTYSRPEPRFAFQNHPAQWVWHAYYLPTRGGAHFQAPFRTSHGYGLMASARYWNRAPQNLPTFIEAGWGVHLQDKWTDDVDLPLSSSPFIGMGVLVDIGGQEAIFATRLIHISNAGIGARNRGLNALVFSLEFKF